jgi:starch synthase
MKLLIAASEARPYVKTGGLADVTGALLEEYGRMGMEAYLVLPLYRSVKQSFDAGDTGLKITVPVGDRQYSGRIFSNDSSAFFLECEDFFDRNELYGTPEGDYRDNAARFVFFDRALLEACRILGLKPDVIHCNDWQTGLVPVYLKTLYGDEHFKRTATVITIHNLGYQGLFEASQFNLTGLPPEWFNPEGLEFYGKVNFLKAGIVGADIVTTVSDTYAREILTAEYGFGLDGVLRKRSADLFGVRNGIDTSEWDPENDGAIPARYNVTDLSGKSVCRHELLRECSLGRSDSDFPLVAMLGRLSTQKGVDMVLQSAGEILSMGAKLIMLGKGDGHFERRVAALGEAYKGKVYVKIGYDEAFAHRIYAGSDFLLMPSQYEPCGLSQLIAMRYGTIPVARRTGGLADTVTDWDPVRESGTGFLFGEYSAAAMTECLRRAFSVYADRRKWRSIISHAMNEDFSWKNSAARYVGLYRKALEMKAAAAVS